MSVFCLSNNVFGYENYYFVLLIYEVPLITETIDTPPNDLTDDFNLINLWVYCQATTLQMELTDAVNVLDDADLAVVLMCLHVLAVVVVHTNDTNLLTYFVICHNCNLFKGFVLLLF